MFVLLSVCLSTVQEGKKENVKVGDAGDKNEMIAAIYRSWPLNAYYYKLDNDNDVEKCPV